MANARPPVLALVLVLTSILVPNGRARAGVGAHPRLDLRATREFIRATPEHKLVVVDTGEDVATADTRLDTFRELLGQVDAVYCEDARTIAEITEYFCRELREAGHYASALDVLEGSLYWRDDNWLRAGKRSFELYAVLYTSVRLSPPIGRRRMSHGRAIWMLRATPLPKWAEKPVD
jgi:hypothetical protein